MYQRTKLAHSDAPSVDGCASPGGQKCAGSGLAGRLVATTSRPLSSDFKTKSGPKASGVAPVAGRPAGALSQRDSPNVQRAPPDTSKNPFSPTKMSRQNSATYKRASGAQVLEF